MTQTQAPHTQPPLDQPLYGATLAQAVNRFFRKYATFSGRASRSEYWWVYLFIILVSFVLSIGIGIAANATRDPSSTQPGRGAAIFAIPLVIFGLAIIVPAISLHVRRLHDANFSGLLYLITLIPYLGSFALLILAILPSNPAGARFDAGGGPLGTEPYPSPGAGAAPLPGYTTAPPVAPGPPPQAGPPPVAPPSEPPTA